MQDVYHIGTGLADRPYVHNAIRFTVNCGAAIHLWARRDVFQRQADVTGLNGRLVILITGPKLALTILGWVTFAGDRRGGRWGLRVSGDRVKGRRAGKRYAHGLALLGKQKRRAFGNARQVRITATTENAPPLLELV